MLRRVLALSCCVVFVDTALYAALTPLLPHFVHEFHLSKRGAGLLVAAYAGGALLGGIPGGIAAARFGPRRAVLAGLANIPVPGRPRADGAAVAALRRARRARAAPSGRGRLGRGCDRRGLAERRRDRDGRGTADRAAQRPPRAPAAGAGGTRARRLR